MTTSMFQVSDLAGSRRREFLDIAKHEQVSLRDTDGSVLVMQTAQSVAAVTEAASVAVMLFAAEAVLKRSEDPSPSELGGLAWLTEFDEDDRVQALTELRDGVALAVAHEDPAPLRAALHAWATTAAVMRDPIRRAVHTGSLGFDDYVEVFEPAASPANA